MNKRKYFKKENKIKGNGIASKIYQKIANIYRKYNCPKGTRMLHDGELHPLCANFEGPGTRLDLAEVRNAKPFNLVDEASRIHDFAYEDAKKIKDLRKRALAIQEADRIFINTVSKIQGNEPYKSLGLAGIGGKFGIEQLLSVLKNAPTVVYGGNLSNGLEYM
jgi:hypothetical protein